MNNFSEFSYDKIIGKTDYSLRKTKIVCTIGPSCSDIETLCKMMEAGMSVARLNFSHGDHKSHGETLAKIREAAKKTKSNCSIMLDTKGPEIRTGFLQDHAPINLEKDQDLILTTDYNFIGNKSKIAVSYQDLATSVKVGGNILIADGSLVCEVKEILPDGVKVRVDNNAKIGEKKNVNLPGCKVNLPTVTEKDEMDILEFGLKKGIDIIALSFCRTAKDVEDLRDLMGPRGSLIKIIPKIENLEGLENYDEILKVSDGIMVARGDLGMEIPPQKVFVAQKWMIKKANQVAKPIITATQMMESMVNNPRPTRAEASDVANAVLDGTDCVMLSGETANGSFPVKAVETMAKICSEAELCFDNQKYYWGIHEHMKAVNHTEKEAVAATAVQLSLEINTNVIVCFTQSGSMARMLAKYRPKAFIVSIGIEEGVIKGLSISRGVVCLRVPSFHGIDSLVEYAIRSSMEMNLCQKGQSVIVIQGNYADHPTTPNVLKIVYVK